MLVLKRKTEQRKKNKLKREIPQVVRNPSQKYSRI